MTRSRTTTALGSVAGLAALAFGLSTVTGTGASTATKTVDALAGSSAVIHLSNAPSRGTAVVGAEGLRPGSTRSGTVTVVNDGSRSVALRFRVAGVNEGGAAPQLSDTVTLAVDQGTDPIVPATPVADPSLSAAQTVTTLAAGASTAVKVTIDWPATATDPDLQGKSFTAQLRFLGTAGS